MNVPLLNRNPGREFVFVLLLACLTAPAWSLSTDKDQPIEVVADTAELDDLKNKSVYTGEVVVTQGSIRMTGNKMTVYHTEDDELDTLIMEGTPATYRQLPDDSEIYDEAEALTIEYYELQNLIILIDQAEVRQEDMTMSGDRIDYDTELSQVKAQSKASTTTETSGETGGETGRVRVILKKQKDQEQAAEPADAPDEQ